MLQIVLKYTCFAIIAIAVNLLTQMIVVRFYPEPYGVYLALFTGTGIGLIVKYILDKRYIFAYFPASHAEDAKAFMLYTATGVITTALFWGTELGFDYIFKTEGMRLTGGALGLVIGYFLKFRLDKKFVFQK